MRYLKTNFITEFHKIHSNYTIAIIISILSHKSLNISDFHRFSIYIKYVTAALKVWNLDATDADWWLGWKGIPPLETIPAIPILQLTPECNAVVAVTSPPHQNQWATKAHLNQGHKKDFEETSFCPLSLKIRQSVASLSQPVFLEIIMSYQI